VPCSAEVPPGYTCSHDCTTTLVSPDVFLTAAHCVTFQSSADALGDKITVTLPQGADGAKHVYAVDAYVSYSTGLGPDDLALLHLTTTVPSTVALPDALATAVPSIDTTATVYGYGCTDRASQDGRGTKRRIVYTFTGQTSQLCPGDSGGPTFDQDGNVFWVSSAYDVNSGVDVYADVGSHRALLQAQIASWDACAGHPPATAYTFDDRAGLCIATTYYCVAKGEAGAPIANTPPEGFGHASTYPDGCNYNGWSGQPAVSLMWQENFCRPCAGQCEATCPR
jgi:hypothetical protein